VTKIFNVNNLCVIFVGGSGDADNIMLFVDHLKQEFCGMSSNEIEFRDKIRSAFLNHLNKPTCAVAKVQLWQLVSTVGD
jgi:hypothetical protein